jgi:hypothetical protein
MMTCDTPPVSVNVTGAAAIEPRAVAILAITVRVMVVGTPFVIGLPLTVMAAFTEDSPAWIVTGDSRIASVVGAPVES